MCIGRDVHENVSFYYSSTFLLNPFVANAPFLYPLKSWENRKVFWCLQGVEKGCIESKWINWSEYFGRNKFCCFLLTQQKHEFTTSQKKYPNTEFSVTCFLVFGLNTKIYGVTFFSCSATSFFRLKIINQIYQNIWYYKLFFSFNSKCKPFESV